MPYGDGTGLRVFGPATGWGRGACGRWLRRRVFGFGYGRGYARGLGYGYGYRWAYPAAWYPLGKDEELKVLKEEQQEIEAELQEIKKRIEELSK